LEVFTVGWIWRKAAWYLHQFPPPASMQISMIHKGGDVRVACHNFAAYFDEKWVYGFILAAD